jgi:exosortase K
MNRSTATSHTTLPGQAAALGAYMRPRRRQAHVGAARLVAAVFALLIMLALKSHYSSATADQLSWILGPTAGLLAWLTQTHPVYEYGVGYVDFARGIIVAPACAGINFMIMTFGLGAFCIISRIRRLAELFIWLAIVLCSAYGYTLIVNVLRIVISMVLYDADIYAGWLTAERVHRLAGIGIYLNALWLFYICFRIMIDCYGRFTFFKHIKKEPTLPIWFPYCWYVLGAVGVPLANGLFHQRAPSLVEHCITVLITVACFWGIVRLVGWLLNHNFNKTRSIP